MKRMNAGDWDALHASMLRSEFLGGAVTLSFQALVVAVLLLG